MKIRIPRFYDVAMDKIACVLFPPPKKIGNIYGRDITLTDIALIGYTLAIGVGLSLFFGTWFWLAGTIASMALAAIMFGW